MGARGQPVFDMHDSWNSGSVNDSDNYTCPPVGVDEEEWVSEAALWTLWIHLGDLEANTECQVVTIETKSFGAAVSTNVIIMPIVQAYAQKFCVLLNNLTSQDVAM